MMKDKLEIFLQTQGFFQLTSRLSEISALVKFENNLANILQIVEYSDHLYLDREQFGEVKTSLKQMFQNRGISEIHILTVVLSKDDYKAEALSRGDAFCWQINTDSLQLVIHEDKHPDFYGVKALFEDFLVKYREDPSQIKPMEEEVEKPDSVKEKFIAYWKKAPYVTISIVVINLVLCFCCIMNPRFFYGNGALGLSYVLEGDYYRILTSIFLHVGLDHYFSNMLLLYCLGNMLESRMGRIRYGVFYLLSGVIGNILACYYEYVSGINTLSVGASGSVFGVVGMLFFMVMYRDMKIKMSMPAILILVFYCVYTSVTDVGEVMAAHLGGLLGGMLLMFLFYPRRKLHEG